MPGLSIEEMPEDLYRKLKAQAARHDRSVSEEAIALLQRGLQIEDRFTDPPAPHKGSFQLDENFLDAAKREGRN